MSKGRTGSIPCGIPVQPLTSAVSSRRIRRACFGEAFNVLSPSRASPRASRSCRTRYRAWCVSRAPRRRRSPANICDMILPRYGGHLVKPKRQKLLLNQGSIADMRMSSLAIIEDLDVIKQIHFRLILVGVDVVRRQPILKWAITRSQYFCSVLAMCQRLETEPEPRKLPSIDLPIPPPDSFPPQKFCEKVNSFMLANSLK
jgi:hypothetical protein